MTKTVLITGTSSGIGYETVRVFADAGWNVAATTRDGKSDDSTLPKSIRVYKLDVTDPSSIKNAFKATIKSFGSIDVVVNNAGYALEGVFEAFTEEQIQKQFDTNVFGVMRVTKAAIEVMRPQKNGMIIQVSSMGGRVTFPLYSLYHSSKWAVEGFSESLHYELRQFNIRIKLIEPGVIKTNFYGQSRVFTKPDIRYGYDSFVDNVESIAQNAGSKGEDPKVVAKAILRAAEDTSSKLRYSVGNPAPALLLARRLLPDRLFFKLVRMTYKI